MESWYDVVSLRRQNVVCHVVRGILDKMPVAWAGGGGLGKCTPLLVGYVWRDLVAHARDPDLDHEARN